MNDVQTDMDALSIAVIGMSCRFPGAETVAAFWQNLRNGVESITFFADDELEISDPALINHPRYVKAGAVLPNIDSFDAGFFGLNARDATTMDPQIRLLLECAWEAFEEAGYDPTKLSAPVGVYTGSGMDTYLLNNVLQHATFAPESHYHVASVRDFQLMQGHEKDFLSTRISYTLNLQGPSITIQTACSTSLVAVHLACQGLLNGECDMALAGGVTVSVPQKAGYLYHDDLIFAPDGHTRSFDAAAQGTVFGNGAGLVVLKRLEDALADGDCIYAVIKGSAINNDGALKVGYAAPSVERQAAVILAAQAAAAVAADSITYIEAHGTATILGDPVEIAGLTQAFRQSTQRNEYCAIGSVKTNVGHLAAAAGVAGLIKTVLALKHQALPPNLHFTQPNPQIHFERTPFYVNRTLTEWTTNGTPRRAGVSSFGLGGTNAHVILEEAPANLPQAKPTDRPRQILTLSAKDDQALRDLVTRYHDYFAAHPHVNLADVCFTANSGRRHFDHRLAVMAESVAQVQALLRTFPAQATGIFQGQITNQQQISINSASTSQRIAFLFTGQGSQYRGMAQQLYQTHPTFRATLDRCTELLQKHLDQSLLAILYPETGDNDRALEAPITPLIDQTTYTQPALFALEYALAMLWQSWGIQPDLLIGHSVGELAAACVAGVFSLEDGLKLVAARGRLIGSLPQDGAMVSLSADEARVQKAIAAHMGASTNSVSIAAVNGPQSVVISGKREAVLAIAEQLAAEGVRTRQLTVSHAFHSPLMEPMLHEFGQVAASITYHKPKLPLVSTLTGKPAGDEVATPAYWVRHVRDTVRFADGVANLQAQDINIFLEIGPKPTLLGMLQAILDLGGSQQDTITELDGPKRQQPKIQNPKSTILLPSLRENQSDWQQMLESLGQLHVQGLPIDWRAFDADYTRQRVSLPTYPFQRQRYWLDAPKSKKLLAESLRPLIHRQVKLPLTKQTVFETEFSLDTLPFLTDHRVYDAVVVAGGCTLAVVLSSAELALKQSAFQIEDVIWPEALIVPADDTRTVQLVLTPTDQESFTACQLISFAKEGDEEPLTHLLGRIVAGMPTAAAWEDLTLLQQRCRHELNVALDLYQARAEQQIVFGPCFRWVTQIWRGDGEALGKLELPEAVGDLAGYILHPAMLDACFQVASVVADEPSQINTVLMPFAIEVLRIYESAQGQEWWCHAHQVSDRKWNIRLLNKLGQVIAEIVGFQVRAAGETVAQAAEVWRQWLYRSEWQRLDPVQDELDPTVLRPQANVPKVIQARPYLIFSDASGIGAALAMVLHDRGQPSVLIYPGESYQQISTTTYQIRPDSAADYRQLLAAIPNVCAVIHLWSLDTPAICSVSDLEAAAKLGVGTLLPLVQTLLQVPTQPDTLWLVTCGTQAVTVNDKVAGFAQAALWGMGRTIALEHPEVNYRQVDLDQDATVITKALQLYAEIVAAASSPSPADQVSEDQIAIRGGLHYAPRLIRYEPQSAQAIAYRANGSYLITGGLGGIGLATARWLAEQGAGHLILMGRTPPKPEILPQLATLADLGAKITVVQADVACTEQVARVLAAVDENYPLCGIVHAAGVFDDAMLHNQTWERLAHVLSPKVKGAWNLHILTQGNSLDFFVVFASGAGLLGNRGQANYAAANACLDSFVQYRHAQNLPALSIDWGAWAEIGAAAALKQTELNHLEEQGVKFMPPAQALGALGALLTQTDAQAAVLAVNWPKYLRKRGRLSPFFAKLVPPAPLAADPMVGGMPQPSFRQQLAAAQVGIIPAKVSALGRTLTTPQQATPATAQLTSPTLRKQLQTLSGGERSALLERYLRAKIAQVLHLPSGDEIGKREHLFNLGIDSLMAIELKNKVQADLGCTLRATLLFDHPTLEGLLAHLDKLSLDTQSASTALPLVRVDRNQPLPLSFAQQRLWFNQTTNRASSYNIVTPWRLEGKLDMTALEQSLDALLQRHEILRTIFPAVDGTPRQVITEPVPVKLVPIDLQDLPPAEQTAAIEGLIQQEVQYLYDLAQGPLMRVILAKLATECHFLLFSFNHILIDAESLAQIFDELSTLYTALTTDVSSPLPTLPLQYADYAYWQRHTLTPAIVESRISYWLQRFTRDTNLFELYSDKPRPVTETFRGRIIPFQMTIEQTAQIKALQSSSGATLFSSVLAVWTALLYRYGQGEELVVGAPFSNRTHQELARVIGHWGSMLLLALRFQGNPTFLDLIRQVSQATQEAMSNDVPFDQLVQALPKESKRNNLPHQFLFSFLPVKPTVNWDLSGLAITTIEKKTNMLRPDLVFMVWEDRNSGSSSLGGHWVYKIELLEEESVVRMMEDFHTFLDVVLADPTCPINDVQLPNLRTLMCT